mmetsp:Transcript_25599/g.46358  ORF Transcript_25599/g.46358 Transcript_25599/m.46358 type:complete len:235 (-) Transcript_25599:1355-2059(-)
MMMLRVIGNANFAMAWFRFVALAAALTVGARAFAFQGSPTRGGSLMHSTAMPIRAHYMSNSPLVSRRDVNVNVNPLTVLHMGTDQDFWSQQKELAESITAEDEGSSKQARKEQYSQRVNGLLSDSLFFTFLFFSLFWATSSNPFTSISYLFGALLGTAYTYGLGKSVQSLGGTVDDADDVKGAGIGNARFAFLIVLFVIVGKFRSQGMQEIPAIGGFFTYQLASLTQGLKEFDD